MLHTAIIAVGIPTVEITFNCSDPANSVHGYYGPGTITDADKCETHFNSATVAGVEIPDGVTVDLEIGGVAARAKVSTTDSGRHITVEVTVAGVP